MGDTARAKRTEYRLRALARSAVRDRTLAPNESLEIGFDLIDAARRLEDDARTSLVRRRRSGG